MNFPFVSQVGNAVVNDCGPACVAMYSRAYKGTAATAASIAAKYRVSNETTGGRQLESMLKSEGVPASFDTKRGLSWHREQWAAHKPTIALVSYENFPEGQYAGDFAHWLVAVQETERGVVIHDPLFDGPVTRSVAQFEKAINDVAPGNWQAQQAVAPLEGLVKENAAMGWNILADTQDLTADRYNALKAAMIAHPPAAMVVINHLGRALDLRKALPKSTEIIYRITTGGNPDDFSEIQFPDPDRYLLRSIKEGDFLTAGAAGLTIYVNNEPNEDSQCFIWLKAVAEDCVRRGFKAVLGNWSVGKPYEHRWKDPYARELLAYVAKHPDKLSIGLHEYAPANMAFEVVPESDRWNMSRWPAKAPGKPYLVGRFRWLVEYARSQGWFIPIYITEHGTDLIRDFGPHGTIGGHYEAARALWAGKGIHDHERFWSDQLQWGWKAFYQDWPEIRGATYFCWGGDSSDIWPAFDVSEYPQILQRTSTGDFSVKRLTPVAHPVPSPGWYRLNYVPGMNIRTNATTNAGKVGVLSNNVVFEVLPNAPVFDDNYGWLIKSSGV